jgi:hypothetical protein
MFKIARYIFGAGLVFAATAASAGDLPADTADGVMDACRADYHRMCSYVVPGEGRAARCLLDHQRELAPYCLQSLKIASAAEDCLPDYERFCPGVPKGKEAFQCLAGRMDRLAPSCRRVVSANAPYMLPQQGERYSDNGGYGSGAAPYSGPAYGAPSPYSRPSPYAGPNPDPYAGGEEQDAYGYGGTGEGQRQPYNGYAYPGDPRTAPSYDGYADRAGPRREPDGGYSPYHYGPGYGGRYAEGAPRFRSYDDGYTGGYAAPEYGTAPAPRAPY